MTSPCPATDGSSPKQQKFDGPPPMCIDPSKRYTAEMVTSKGTLTIALDPIGAPATVNNFVFLARYHYYDGIVFHRIIPGFVLQGGDPTGSGSGGPGYRYHYYEGIVFHRIIPGFMLQGGDPTGSGRGGPGYRFDDELPAKGRYELGSLAMANAGPNTNGSQFFVISGPAGVGLPPQYSLFGKVVAGIDVVAAIEAVGTSSGSPKETVTIESVTITEAD